MMITLTPDAESRLDQYLLRVRRSVRGTSLEPEGIDRDIRAHVEQALEGTSQPVGRPDLDRVLDRLGDPSQWVPDEEMPPLRRLAKTLMHGPEDWRLPYLSFGLTLFGVILFPVGGPLLILAAFLLSRAAVDYAETHGINMTARRWLLYPALVFVLAPLALFILIAPVAGATAWWVSEGGYRSIFPLPAPIEALNQVRVFGGFILLASGAWLMILAALLVPLRRAIVAIAYPIVRNVRGRYAAIAAGIGVVLAVLGGLAMLLL